VDPPLRQDEGDRAGHDPAPAPPWAEALIGTAFVLLLLVVLVAALLLTGYWSPPLHS
jgi:hypothetical protein